MAAISTKAKKGQKALYKPPLLNTEAKILIAIAALAVAGRAFVLFALPEASLTDSLYHLTIIKYIIQFHALPMQGIEGTGVASLPVPLYHILSAMFFSIVPIQLNLATAKILPFVFSALQLFLGAMVLKKLFPKHWLYGFAFIAMQPLLMIFGAVNYPETLASVFVLFALWIMLRYSETGKSVFLLTMPFAIAGMVLSKESATVVAPAFFIVFLYELWKKRPKKAGAKNSKMQWAAKAAYFTIATALLSCAWFVLGASATVNKAAGEGLYWLIFAMQRLVAEQMLAVIVFYPLYFNAAFWFFLGQGFASAPFGITAEIAFAGVSLITFPLLCFLFYGIGKGIQKKEMPSALLLLCFLLAFGLMFLRAERQIDSRNSIPIMPLFGIAACSAFMHVPSTAWKMPNAIKFLPAISWKKVFTALLILTTFYSIGLSGFYAMHFYSDNAAHAPLFEFISAMPEASVIAIHPNKARQVYFTSGKDYVPLSQFQNTAEESLFGEMQSKGVTHIAITCYKEQWRPEAIKKMLDEGLIGPVYEDSCSTLYKLGAS